MSFSVTAEKIQSRKYRVYKYSFTLVAFILDFHPIHKSFPFCVKDLSHSTTLKHSEAVTPKILQQLGVWNGDILRMGGTVGMTLVP